MSMSAVLLATRDHLRNNIGAFIPGYAVAKAKNYVGIRPSGRPPASFGDWFIGLDEISVQSNDKSFLREVFAIKAVVTHRASHVPPDRYDELYELTGTSIETIERRVLTLIHDNQELRRLACRLANVPDKATGDIFQTPLWYQGRVPSRTEDGEWVGAEHPDRHAFLVRELPFAGMARVQALDIMH
jgi:hypothetical protein